uniref:YtxH domain-containing protein n=1 Tax=candidate division WWE3 bacterium TaxID=2053526 RepID=A0A7C4TLI9_UNCKA
MECKHCGKNHSDFGSFVSGAMWGALAGALLGMLYAPEKGQDIREKLKDVFDDAEEKGEKLGKELKFAASEIKDAAQPFINEIEKSVKPVLSKAKKSGQDVQLQVMEKIEQLVEDASSGYDEGKNMKKFFKGAKKK